MLIKLLLRFRGAGNIGINFEYNYLGGIISTVKRGRQRVIFLAQQMNGAPDKDMMLTLTHLPDRPFGYGGMSK
ncbi:MAG: hypothetical protein ACJAUP_002423 [Cellvibrionaceae bacterium]|jgi:hypothetical protein